MPELPEVETIRLAMASVLPGRQVVHTETRRDGLRVPFPSGLEIRLKGRRIVSCDRLAKYILTHLDDGQVLVFHLGMSGRILLHPANRQPDQDRHDHLVIGFDDDSALIFNDPRRFGIVLLEQNAGLSCIHPFNTLGPEPLEEDFTGPYLAAALKGRKTAIKAALMDQSIVAGLGNIYVCEALYVAGIDPKRPAQEVRDAETLVRAIRSVLEAAIRSGGSTLRDYRNADGNAGRFQHNFSVYGRAGKPCPDCSCDIGRTGGIGRISQGGRSTFFCPERQR